MIRVGVLPQSVHLRARGAFVDAFFALMLDLSEEFIIRIIKSPALCMHMYINLVYL